MRFTVTLLMFICMISGNLVVFTLGSSPVMVDDQGEMVKRWQADQEFVDEHYLRTKVHTTKFDFKNGKFNQEKVEVTELLFFDGQTMTRKIREGKAIKFKPVEKGPLDINAESLAKLINSFAFIDKQSMEYPPEPAYDEITFIATPGAGATSDFEKVAVKLGGTLQRWAKDGSIKSLVASLNLKEGEDVKVKRLGGIVGANIHSLKINFVTQSIDDKIVPKIINIDYEINGTGVGFMVKKKRHETIEFTEYKRMTSEEMANYFNKSK